MCYRNFLPDIEKLIYVLKKYLYKYICILPIIIKGHDNETVVRKTF